MMRFAPNYRNRYTPAELQYIKDNIDKPDHELDELMGRSDGAIKGIRRAKRILKGRPKVRTINKRALFVVYEHYNHKNGKKSLRIKLPDNPCYIYGRYLWEQTYGVTLGTTECMWYKDGNPLNCQLSNLEVIQRYEMHRRLGVDGNKKIPNNQNQTNGQENILQEQVG
jgi:hypothetical protein